MRQEPRLSDLDALDEPSIERRSSAGAQPQVVIKKSGAGAFLWLLVVLNLAGLAGLGYLGLNAQGRAQLQGNAVESTNARLARALEATQSELQQLARTQKNQGIVDDELANRLDLVTGQGVSANAAEVKRVQSTLREQETQLNAVTARLDALLADLGQNKDTSQSLTGRVTTLANSLAALETRLGGMEARLSGQDELIESVAGRFAPLTAALARQTEESGALQTGLVRVEGITSDNQANLDEQRSQLDRLEGRLVEVATLAAQQPVLQPDRSADIALLQDQITVQRRELTEISERLRSIDQFRIQTNRLTQRLEDGLREVQAQ